MTTKYEAAFLIGFIIAAIFCLIFYIKNNDLENRIGNLVKKNKELETNLLNSRNEVSELKRFPKPSDPSRLDAALSEIDELKSRLRVAEVTARNATEKAKIASSVLEGRKHYFDKCCELTEDNRKLKEEIKTIQQKTPRPQYIYSSSEVERQISDYKNKLYQKSEEIKSLKYKLSTARTQLEQTQEDLDDILETNSQLQAELAFSQKNQPPADEYARLIEEAVPRVASLPFAQIPDDFKESIASGRLNNAFKSHLMIVDKMDISATIKSDHDTYQTTLHSCTCPDHVYRHNVCKHMLFLSYTSGLLLLNKEIVNQHPTS